MVENDSRRRMAHESAQGDVGASTSDAREEKNGQESGSGSREDGSAPEGGNFECNICLDLAQDPVITLCGHLFCWGCLYRWLQLGSNCKECPVCKAGVSEDNVIPLYGRGMGSKDPRTKPVSGPDIPSRPQGQRPEAVRQPHPQYQHGVNFFAGPAGPFVGAQFGNFTLSAGFGLFPSLFGFQLQSIPMFDSMAMHNGQDMGAGGGAAARRGGMGSAVSPETQQQQFLSRLLLLLGTFAIICLILF